ncbi:MAG: hypothetical protein JST22_14650 [Bacteroidetes bacterium]|nr:hypothetical protein [Bacteroidota bacterium]
MNTFPFRSGLALLLLPLLALGACKKNNPEKHPETPKAPAAAPSPVTTSSLDQAQLRSLLVQGYKLYWEVGSMGTKETGTVGNETLVRMDPAKAPNLKTLRTKLEQVFTNAAADSILADFGVREHDGKLWMDDVEDGDVSNYDETEIVDFKADSTTAEAMISVPLGDSGQVDEWLVRAVRVGGVWKLANNPYAGNDLDDADDGDDGSQQE